MKIAWERLVFKAEAVTGTEAKWLIRTVRHLDPKWSEAYELCQVFRFLSAQVPSL